ncbi:alpha/beta hydrolase [Streptomyces cinereoruber]|uniref:Alpha/beta hydrolase n=1 Tax=Streptomyces cinereoruber TaxID=67260 RepID=A0AAV4KTG9_9ACTN|nr:alpha/beta hydrolase [Streptomyces cinereoruber]MBB4161710.1 pimeloyl-ACP methyl ester carboxylesterase [Streptomyces cinereoruber]MBY8820029.1 alpha/beta hydrolase [Streptomyces cinereoruber]NIH65395.1 pimeloyl-ACP methyl ester carboxylesterase [Streptomyces cinereoruber]QEV30872.1 alpha/beta hydrolase [Streptomyces cinereoruber]GGR48155.1 alpha/beta hydrolase [Streptomyces cinereoruber]
MATAREQSARAEARVTSADGTEIAFEQSGRGPAVVLVASALADRTDTTKLAALLAQHFTVINYDRRGRGASGDANSYAPDREIEDIAALVEHVGGSASLFGSSSGAVLALRAAAAGVNVDRLALYEPPFVVAEGDDGPPKDLAQQITALLAEGRHSDAVKYFMTRVQGMPGIAVFFMKLMPKIWTNLTKLASTLPYDIAVMGDTQQGKPLEAEEWKGVAVPTRVLTGAKSPTAFQRAALAVTEILSQADHRTLPGLNHGAVVMAPKKIAPQIIEFFKG